MMITDSGSFANPELVSAFKSIAFSMSMDGGVRRTLMLMLLSWHRHFMRDPTMLYVASLYGQCGGVERTPALPNQAKPFKPRHQNSTEGTHPIQLNSFLSQVCIL